MKEKKTRFIDLEKELLFLESRRCYSLSELERDKRYNDHELINLGIIFAKHSIESLDWRFLNLSLKIRDSKDIILDKDALEKEIASAIRFLKKSF